MISYNFAVRTGNLFQSQGDIVISGSGDWRCLERSRRVVAHSKDGDAGTSLQDLYENETLSLSRAP